MQPTGALFRHHWLAGLFACLWMLAGCSARDMKGKLVVIPHRISGPLWLSEHVGVAEAAERHGMTLAWSGPNDEGSLDEQLELTGRAIREHAAGIILSPNVDRVFKRELIRARDQGIPVVLDGESAGIDPMPGVGFVISNLDETGRLIAQRLGELLHHQGEVLIVGVDPYTPGNVEQYRAIVGAIGRLEPRMTVASPVVGSPSPAHSELLIQQALDANKHVQAMVTLSPSDTVAAASTLRAKGQLAQVRIIGCDQSQPVFMLLHLGAIDSFLVRDHRRQGALSVDMIADMLAHRYDTRSVYVDPILVTRDNIGTEFIQQALLMHR